ACGEDGASDLLWFALALTPNLPAVSLTPYFVFRLLADCKPAATWSPCRSRKLFAVEAAVLASDSDTDLGSLRKLEAVFRAACFCAQEVPPLGVAAGAVVPPVLSLEKRDCEPVTSD